MKTAREGRRPTDDQRPALPAAARRANRSRVPLRQRLGDDARQFLVAARFTRAGLIANLATTFLIQAVTVFAALPAIGWMFQAALDAAGIPNVTDRTLGPLLANPLADLLLLAIALIALTAVFLQLASAFAISDRQHRGLPLTVRGITADIARTLRRIFSPQTPLLLIYLLGLAPLGGLGLFSVVTRGISIPPFVTREFMKTPASAALYVAAIAALLFVNALLIYTVPALIIGRLRPIAAMRSSLRMTWRRFLHVPFMITVPIAIAVLFSSGLVEMALDVSDLASHGSTVATAAIAGAIGLCRVIGFTVMAGATVVVMNVLVGETREHFGFPSVAPARDARPRARRIARAVSFRLVGAGAAVALAVSIAPAVTAPVTAAADTVILAHRGFDEGGVENTIGGLEAAVATHPDYVEADFQQTKDGVFVASHDTNLLMVAGVNLNIYDMTAAEVTTTTVSEHGFSDTIPTMKQYVLRARDLGMPLLIELKVHGHEQPGFVQAFLAELDSVGVTERNIYHSLDPGAVREIKDLRPELRVGLTIAMSAGGVPDSPCDFFVIEQASFTRAFLDEAHRLGKPVYVWTVDGDDRIRQYLRIPVDGIVTDQPDDAVRYRAEISGGPDPELVTEDSLGAFSLFR